MFCKIRVASWFFGMQKPVENMIAGEIWNNLCRLLLDLGRFWETPLGGKYHKWYYSKQNQKLSFEAIHSDWPNFETSTSQNLSKRYP